MNLSRHFTLAELTFSRTATAAGIDNTPDDASRVNLEALCRAVLDPLRDDAGGPVKVTSGYRGPVLNRRINGEPKSQHLEGKAADIQPTNMTVLELFKRTISLALPFDQLIYEAKSATSKWVHVSHNAAGNRRQIKVAHFGATGKVERYEPVTAEQALAIVEPATRAAARRAQALEYDEMNDEPPDDGQAGETREPKAPAKKVPAKKRPAKKTAAKVAVTRKTSATKAKKSGDRTVPGKQVRPRKPATRKAPAGRALAEKAAPNKR